LARCLHGIIACDNYVAQIQFKEYVLMTWDEVQGKWKQMKASAHQQFGKLTDGDLDTIAGQREKLIAKLQERYGYTRDDAQKRAEEWLRAAAPAQSQTQQPPPPPQYGDAAAHSQKR
jgi:uncharacterized protein YjbJ (UPF0337 family)